VACCSYDSSLELLPADHLHPLSSFSFFSFNDTATTEIYTLSLHDALPISGCSRDRQRAGEARGYTDIDGRGVASLRHDERARERSEEHTSELQSRENLVCRLLLEKKKKR